MDPNIIYIDKPKSKINRCRGGAVIRINEEAAGILEGFMAQSGLSISKLASNFIQYAANYTEIIEREV